MCAMEPQPRPMKPRCRRSEKECTMCGDVGFQKELFRCSSCRQRYQHRYCSRFYPHVSADESQLVCDWCASTHPKCLIKEQDHHEVDEAPCSTSGRRTGFPSPLDYLLEVAESTLNQEIQEKQQQRLEVVKKSGAPLSVKKHLQLPIDGACGSHTPSSKPMVHKRKRCTDLDMPKDEAAHIKFKTPPKPGTGAGVTPQLISLSKAAGRRYRLLSEVLC